MEVVDTGQVGGQVHCNKVLSTQDRQAGHTRGSLVAVAGVVDGHRKGWETPGKAGAEPAAGWSHKGVGGRSNRSKRQPDQEADKPESAAYFGLWMVEEGWTSGGDDGSQEGSCCCTNRHSCPGSLDLPCSSGHPRSFLGTGCSSS